MDDVKKKRFGAHHALTALTTLIAAYLGGDHVYNRVTDWKQTPYTVEQAREDRKELTDRLDQLSGKLENFGRELSETHTLLKLVIQSRREMKLRSLESRAVINNSLNGG